MDGPVKDPLVRLSGLSIVEKAGGLPSSKKGYAQCHLLISYLSPRCVFAFK